MFFLFLWFFLFFYATGASGSGKTHFTKSLIFNHINGESIRRVTWFYTVWQTAYDDIQRDYQHVNFVRGLPESLESYLEEESGAKVFVFDDMMTECSKSSMVCDAFTKYRHHCNLSVVLILQNIYVQGKVMRSVHLNSQYTVLFQNARDKRQFLHLASQLEPRRSGKLYDCYTDALSKPFGHFLIDTHPQTPEKLRYRSNTLKDDQIVYVV